MSERSAWEVEAAWERFLAQYKDDQTIGLLESFKPELVAWLETELAARPQEPTASQQVRQLVAKLRKRDIADSAYKDSQFWKDLYALLDQLDEAALATQASQPPEAQDALAKAHDEGLREGIKVGFIGGERSMAEKAGQELTNIWIGGMTTQEVRTAFLATIRALAAVEPPQEPKP